VENGHDPPVPDDLDGLLSRLRAGDRDAEGRFLSLVYRQLKAVAHRQLAGNRDSLGSTGLVNEAWLKLFRPGGASWGSRAEFLAMAAHVMRHILVDHARRRASAKRQAARQHVPLDELVDRYERNGTRLVHVDDALKQLAEVDPQLVEVVEMRYFAGYTIVDTARVLGLSPSSVVRAWRVARAWLARELGDG
jgi:RNA polymerase sigma factor (TIGR02999 family)